MRHFRSRAILIRVRLSCLLSVTSVGAALSALSPPGETEPQCSPARSYLCPKQRKTRRRRASGQRLGRAGAGWRLCPSACCCLWELGASAEGPSADSDPLPRPPSPPCRGGRKMPVKKKRKSSGVAAAVAEDGGLKKCKISRYHLPPPFSLSSFLLCRTAGGEGVGPSFPASSWREVRPL